jgi:hypothetical protein
VFRNTFTDKPRIMLFNQIAGHPVHQDAVMVNTKLSLNSRSGEEDGKGARKRVAVS